MKKIIYLFILLNSLSSFSQNTETSGYQLENFAPKSPEAAAFLKYGEYPVDLSTGVPNISIPIYTIDVGDFKLPISLDYHASGIKVDQEATWVGLGWNLKYGAQVILSVRDDVDENNPYIDTIPDDDEIISYWNAHPFSFNTGPVLNEHLDKSRVKDVYSFSSPTANGNFYIRNFNTNDVVIFPPDASFKVELIGFNRSNLSFKITDSFGNIYFFEDTKEKSVRTLTHNDEYISAWYVDKIKTAKNNEINFIYQNDGNINDYSFSQRVEIKEIGTNACSNQESISRQVGQIIDEGGTTITHAKKIKEIIFNNGKSIVYFNKLNNRLDLSDIGNNGYLNSIEIKQYENAVFTFKKGFSFEYSYFTSNDYNSQTYKMKRLKLERLIDMIDGEGHQFYYSDVNLPSKNSKSKDYYGYYNGAINYNLIPKHFITSPYNIEVGSANRNVNPLYNQAGMLTEIHYPTKGWTKFNYETNQYYGVDELEKYTLRTVNSNLLQGTGTGSAPPYLPLEDEICTANCVEFRQVPFQSINASGTLTFQALKDPSVSNNEIRHSYTRVRVYSSTGLVYDSNKQLGNLTFSFTNLNSGTILMEAYGSIMSIANLQLRYVNNDLSLKNNLGSGLRISSIENYSFTNNVMDRKEYNYSDIIDSAKTSGKLVNNLTTSFSTNMFVSTDIGFLPCEEIPCDLIPRVNYSKTYNISSNSRYNIEGNSVIYEYVKELKKDVISGKICGYNISKFNIESDIIPLGDPSLYITNNWKRGKLIEQKIYGLNGSNNYLIKFIKNNHLENYSKTSSIEGFKMFTHSSVNYSSNVSNPSELGGPYSELRGSCYVPSDIFEQYEIITYSIPILWFYQNSTETTDYFYDSSNTLTGSVTNTTNYFYDNPDHLQLTRTESSNSNNETVKTVNYYPHDLTSSSPIMSSLISKNRIGEVVKTENFKNNNLISSRNTIYKDWGNSLILPEIIQSSKGSPASLENRIKFNLIDNTNGNPLELQQENGTVVTYLWGYNKTLPIAKIENATNAQVQTALGMNLTDVTEANMSTISTLRSSLPNAMVTTYTHIPLVGVSTITDPKGDTITYTYDSFNRLKEVKDKNGNKLSENEYHYKP